MIKIFYRDLSPGLHASAEAEGRNTVISFLPGLTPDQRRAALRRIRHSGRMGHGPRVPAGKLAIALALDRVKAAVRTGAAVVRLHPAGSTLPVVFFSAAAVIFVLMATVSIHVLPAAPRSSGPGLVVGGVTPAPPTSAPVVSQSVTPSGGNRASRMGTVPGRLAARQFSSPGTTAVGSSGLAPASQGSGSAVSSASPAAGTGSAPTSSATGSAGSPGSSGSPGSPGSGGTTGSAGTGSGSSGASGGSGSGTSSGGGGSSGSGSAGSSGSGSGSSGSGSGSSSGTGSGSGSGVTPGSGGTGSGGTGSGGAGSGGAGSGGAGSGGAGSGGAGSGGAGSGGAGSGGAGSGGAGSGGAGSGGAGSGGAGSGGAGSGSTGSSSATGSGSGTCVTLLSISLCAGL